MRASRPTTRGSSGGAVDDETFAERGRLDARACIEIGRGAERLHQHQPAALAGVLRVVAPGRGPGEGAERVRELAAGVGEAVFGAPGVRAALRRQELVLERHAAGDQPVVELDAALAVGAQPLVVRTRLHRGAQVAVHLLGCVVEAARALQRRATSEVDRAAGERARPTAGELALQHQHVRPGTRRLRSPRRRPPRRGPRRPRPPRGPTRGPRTAASGAIGAVSSVLIPAPSYGGQGSGRRRIAVASCGRVHCARRPVADAACRSAQKEAAPWVKRRPRWAAAC